MVYDSLCLSCDGGIIADAAKNMQNKNSAALVLGLGGIGIEALTQLKGKIRAQLQPDGSEDGYDGIQLLAIDSDETDYQKYKGNCRLSKNEFFSIRNPSLAAILTVKDPVKNDPFFSWMEIDNIAAQLSPEGAGGVRQIGRYLLFNKADEVKYVLESKVKTALMKRGVNDIDVYVFAGLSGGTGSGIFLDTCYILRQILAKNGWSGRILGYFFLPDVAVSKAQVFWVLPAREYNEANGYAALRELDHFMNLKTAGAWFEQEYSPSLRIHTQEPPVDLCHLVSATGAGGVLLNNVAINVATEHVLAHLSDVPAGVGGVSVPASAASYHAEVLKGVNSLPNSGKENLCYQVIGACTAEIPKKEILTYLAGAFFKKLQHSAEQRNETSADVLEFANKLHLTVEGVADALQTGFPSLEVPDEDLALLRRMGQPGKGRVHEGWARSADEWNASCHGRMLDNAHDLLAMPDGYDYGRVNGESLVGKVFCKLLELAKDPAFGPYYAAQLLHNGEDGLGRMIHDAICYAEQRRAEKRAGLNEYGELFENTKEAFYASNILTRRRAYEEYKNGFVLYYRCMQQVNVYDRVLEVLHQVEKQVENLYGSFFHPFVEMLQNLNETFEANRVFTDLLAPAGGNGLVRQIVTVDEVKERLDGVVADLPDSLYPKFVAFLLEHTDCWIDRDEEKIIRLVREEMLKVFAEEASRSFEDYLSEKYPGASPHQLADTVKKELLDKAFDGALPNFCFDLCFNEKADTHRMISLEVPAASAVCGVAAENFGTLSAIPVLQKAGAVDHISVLRTYCGVPLRAVGPLNLMKAAYDRICSSPSGSGIHLDKKWIAE